MTEEFCSIYPGLMMVLLPVPQDASTQVTFDEEFDLVVTYFSPSGLDDAGVLCAARRGLAICDRWIPGW